MAFYTGRNNARSITSDIARLAYRMAQGGTGTTLNAVPQTSGAVDTSALPSTAPAAFDTQAVSAPVQQSPSYSSPPQVSNPSYDYNAEVAKMFPAISSSLSSSIDPAGLWSQEDRNKWAVMYPGTTMPTSTDPSTWKPQTTSNGMTISPAAYALSLGKPLTREQEKASNDAMASISGGYEGGWNGGWDVIGEAPINQYGYFASEPKYNPMVRLGDYVTGPFNPDQQVPLYHNTQFGWVPMRDLMSNASSKYISKYAALQDAYNQEKAANEESTFSKIYETALPMVTKAVMSYGVGSVLSEAADLVAGASGLAGATGDSGTLFGFNDIIPKAVQQVGQTGANIAMSKNPQEALIQAAISQGLNAAGDYTNTGSALKDVYGAANEANQLNKMLQALTKPNQYPVSEKFSEMGTAYQNAREAALQNYLAKALLNSGMVANMDTGSLESQQAIQQDPNLNYNPTVVSGVAAPSYFDQLFAAYTQAQNREREYGVSRNKSIYNRFQDLKRGIA